ncbi:SiaB family protein kinase [Imperialibacter roseus]|uniref:SiaB family protein kinase n=1 Tax=Imperialibacter roseus TaxID=1324217 RepID=A0ABZ0IUT1_9BACT|nr:SiaB family protein kinase [Imperialibacter roseus]WOK07705.1 SiaB family protein kinase [Imperialibacter roseus]|tara:strand:+ start:47798 stop:48388 length:591 start_codon:yes stop_codon:yes gene_type:complete
MSKTELKKYKNIHGENIIILYSGDMTFELLNAITACLENKLTSLEEEKKVKKRFYSVAMECLQNLYYHIEEVAPDNENITKIDAKSVTVVVYMLKRHFVIQTSNFVSHLKEQEIGRKIDEINSKSAEELRQLYLNKLSEQGFSEKGTAGLGYIEIARKTTQKLEYLFQKINDSYSLFTLTARIPRTEIVDRQNLTK